MVTTLRSFVMAFCIMVSFSGHAEELTEKQARDFIAKFESSLKTLDVDAVGSLLSDNVKMMERVFFNDDSTSYNERDKKEYLSVMKENQKNYSNYTYEMIGIRLIHLGNNKAEFRYDSSASMTVKDQLMTRVGMESIIVELINGKVLATEGGVLVELNM